MTGHAEADGTVPDRDAVPSIDLPTAAVDALARSPDDDHRAPTIAVDGFRVTATTGDTYTFETAAERHTGLSRAELADAARDHDVLVADWYVFEHVVDDEGARGAFLRWLEGATERLERLGRLDDGRTDAADASTSDAAERSEPTTATAIRDRFRSLASGIEHDWGQLRITATIADDGTRRYAIRHADAAGIDRDHLETHDDPRDARSIAKHDPDGRYRPLKTAPTLPTGWVFPDLDAHECYETVETFYPATVANWDRERRGDLDVSHWHETMARQTGIYGLIETWDRGEGHEHVEWVAETCCADSQCLKRREWEYDAETDLSVDGGDGVFPCREPCSLVVSAARRWTKLESEAERTYEFDLTPSEKEQLEALIDAVADGRVEEIREADLSEGANRYRTRFLRAKRFDDDGTLCGVPTNPEEGTTGE
ncbi:DR2241 family protein [Halopenitus sp. POP-27]|uniref:DR2241 family protein n=1 Tax=Halopenitus sp. POP-27 TaxID=2994425 RepID=UPI0024692270|nr:DR2241 family protein [Halopenitus sp. POP-27]